MSPPTDHSEIQARSFAASGAWGPPARAGAGVPLRPSHVHAVQAAITGPAQPLDPGVRRRFEPELGLDLGAVRVHTDRGAVGSARGLRANAYAVGPHLVFAPGRYQPATAGGRALIAHELAHVAQQSAAGVPALAADVDFWDVVGVVASPAAAQVGRSLNVSGWDVLEAVGKATMGETMWKVLRAFAHGFEDGLRHAPAAQVQHLEEKWGSISPSDAYDFTGGYLKGILYGLWNGLVGLVETVVALVKLPIQVVQFLQDLPQIASRWGPRIAQLIQRGGVLMGQFAAELTNDPAGTVARLRQLAEGAGDAVLNLVRGAGRDAAAEVLKFLDQDWDKIGEDVGRLVGRILFEVLLALATDLIGNVVKEAVRVIGTLFAKGVEAAAEIVRLIRVLVGRVLTWLEGLGGKLAGKLGSLLEELRVFVADFGRIFEQMEPELALPGGGGMRMSATKGLGEGVGAETRALPKPKEPPALPKPTEHAPAPKPTEHAPPPKPAEPPPPKPVEAPFKELSKAEFDKLKPAEREQYLKQWMEAHGRKRVTRSARHHSWPEYLGGPAKQELLSLDEATHIDFHKLLDTMLPRRAGTASYAAKSLAEQAKDIATLRRIARDFDLVEGTRISEQLAKVLVGTPFEKLPF